MLLLMELQIIRRLIVVPLMLTLSVLCVSSQIRQKELESLKLTVVSVRVMSDDESLDRAPHVARTDILVRLRLINETGPCRYYMTYIESFAPVGYGVKLEDDTLFWLSNGKRSTSPGWNSGIAPGGARWLFICRGQAIEWDRFDTTTQFGERHAQSIFVKADEKSDPIEIFSNFYTIPYRK